MTTPDTPYRFELELTVSATPEQVWDAIAQRRRHQRLDAPDRTGPA